jgi:hypothetical protein
MRADATGFRTGTVQRLLERRPRAFADWRRHNTGAFRRTATTAEGA